MSSQYGVLPPSSGWDIFVSLGTLANFKWFRVLAALLYGTLVVGVSQTLQHWTEGATYIRQGGHHVGHWPTFYTVCQKNVPLMACYTFDTHEWILIFFGRNVIDKVGNRKMLYYATSNNLCLCTTWQNEKTPKSHFLLNWIVLHTMHLCAISSWKKKLSSVMCLIASNIYWGSKISH